MSKMSCQSCQHGKPDEGYPGATNYTHCPYMRRVLRGRDSEDVAKICKYYMARTESSAFDAEFHNRQ